MLRREVRYLVAALTATIALLVAAADASANFVYWANVTLGTIGRAKINGTGVNNAFIGGLGGVEAVAVDSKYIYWTQETAAGDSIGRANLDGTGVNPKFIPSSAGVSFPAPTLPPAISVTPTGIYWVNNNTHIATANLDGSGVNTSLVDPTPVGFCGIATDQSFVYWLDKTGQRIGRATLAGGGPNPSFVPLANAGCGLAVDQSFLYWSTGATVGRVPVGGGAPDYGFIPSPGPGFSTDGVAVQPQYIFWVNDAGPAAGASTIGRASINGTGVSQGFIPNLTNPSLPAAAPSNKITINSVTTKKRKGTAAIHAKVPGPGQVTLNQVSTPPDVNATAASVKQVGLTITQASSFTLPVKPTGKTAKKLKKQVRKRGKGKVKQTVFIHFVPSGVAGVPNDQAVTVTLVKQGKKKH